MRIKPQPDIPCFTNFIYSSAKTQTFQRGYLENTISHQKNIKSIIHQIENVTNNFNLTDYNDQSVREWLKTTLIDRTLLIIDNFETIERLLSGTSLMKFLSDFLPDTCYVIITTRECDTFSEINLEAQPQVDSRGAVSRRALILGLGGAAAGLFGLVYLNLNNTGERPVQIPPTPKIEKPPIGRIDILGAEAIEKAFGFRPADETIPNIPFTTTELERANQLGQFLILRIDSIPNGSPLDRSMMVRILKERFKSAFPYDTDIYSLLKRFGSDVPRSGWALVARDFVPGSSDQNYFAQTETLANYVTNQIFNGLDLPPNYSEAVREVKEQKDNITALYLRNGGRSWDTSTFRPLNQAAANLKLNQLTRQRVPEVLYDHIMYLKNRGQRLWLEGDIFTNEISPDGYLISVRTAPPDGYYGVVGSPENSGVVAGGKGVRGLGVVFSRTS